MSRELKNLEQVTEGITSFISSHWGSLVAYVSLISWFGFLAYLDLETYEFIDRFVTLLSLVLIFLLHRSQTKATLSLHLKLNELLAADHHASQGLINIENKTEDEIKELHDRFEAIQKHPPGTHSIDD